MGELLDGAALSDLLTDHQRFRLETLPQYTVDADGGDYERWLAGEREPNWDRKNAWLDVLRADKAAGRGATRVRIFSEQLTDYERYACEWGYALNVDAGEDIRVLHRGEHGIPSGLIERDFWIVDGYQIVLMHYDEFGRFEAAEIVPDDGGVYRRTRDMAWTASEPFLEWWARHPELHRNVAV